MLALLKLNNQRQARRRKMWEIIQLSALLVFGFVTLLFSEDGGYKMAGAVSMLVAVFVVAPVVFNEGLPLDEFIKESPTAVTVVSTVLSSDKSIVVFCEEQFKSPAPCYRMSMRVFVSPSLFPAPGDTMTIQALEVKGERRVMIIHPPAHLTEGK